MTTATAPTVRIEGSDIYIGDRRTPVLRKRRDFKNDLGWHTRCDLPDGTCVRLDEKNRLLRHEPQD